MSDKLDWEGANREEKAKKQGRTRASKQFFGPLDPKKAREERKRQRKVHREAGTYLKLTPASDKDRERLAQYGCTLTGPMRQRPTAQRCDALLRVVEKLGVKRAEIAAAAAIPSGEERGIALAGLRSRLARGSLEVRAAILEKPVIEREQIRRHVKIALERLRDDLNQAQRLDPSRRDN